MENKQRTTIWLSPEVMKQLDDMSARNNCKSRSEFIEQAIKFYDGYNRSTVENQYLPIALSSSLNGILFKLLIISNIYNIYVFSTSVISS